LRGLSAGMGAPGRRIRRRGDARAGHRRNAPAGETPVDLAR
jgi:hypothetical protein